MLRALAGLVGAQVCFPASIRQCTTIYNSREPTPSPLSVRHEGGMQVCTQIKQLYININL